MSIAEIKKLSKEEFMKLEGANEHLYDLLHNAKEGWIRVRHDKTGEEHHGYTVTFGEGISCQMSNASDWFRTSVVQKIDWDNKYFNTLNSKYWFDFIDKDKANELRKEQFEYINKILNGSDI